MAQSFVPLSVKLTPIQLQLVRLLTRHERTVDELMELIYWLHPAERPNRKTIKAHIWHLNQRLRAAGLRVICDDAHGSEHRTGYYRLGKPTPKAQRKPSVPGGVFKDRRGRFVNGNTKLERARNPDA